MCTVTDYDVTMMIHENENDENDADDDGNEVIDKSEGQIKQN